MEMTNEGSNSKPSLVKMCDLLSPSLYFPPSFPTISPRTLHRRSTPSTPPDATHASRGPGARASTRGTGMAEGGAGIISRAVTAHIISVDRSASSSDATHTCSCRHVASVGGALAELFASDRVDDNLTIPLSVGAVLSLLFTLPLPEDA